MATLPLDIFSDIVEELSVNIHTERSALKSLSLTCRALTPICQKVLFRRIDFRYRRRLASIYITRFNSLLISSPHLADYVLYLSYLGQYEDLGETLSAMGRILSVLSHLRSLHLSWLSAQVPWYFDWSALLTDPRATDFCDAVDKVLRSDHLVHLHIPDVKNFPFSSFVDKSKLLDITEDGPLSIQLQIAVPVTGKVSTQPSVKVRNYSVGARSWPRRMIEIVVGDRTCLRSPSSGIPPLDLSSTKDALICAKEQINVVEAEKVMRCTRSLEQLSYEVIYSTWLRGFAQNLLSSCTSTLTVLDLTSTTESEPDPLEAFNDELGLLAGHLNVLQDLSINISLDLSHCPLNSASLTKLDSTITREGFPQLKFLNLNFIIAQNAPWSEIVVASANGDGEGEGGNESRENRPQPTLEELNAQHLSHLKTVKAVDGLEVTYSSALRVQYTDYDTYS